MSWTLAAAGVGAFALGMHWLSHGHLTKAVGAQVAGQAIVALGSAPLDTTFKAGTTTLSANVTSWAMSNGFDAAQTYALTICQPTGATYTVTGAPANFNGALLVPSVAGQCATTALFWVPAVSQWYSFRVPYSLLTGSPSDAGLILASQVPTKLSQLTNDTGFVTSTQTLQPASTTFAATALLAVGTYGPNTISLPNATSGMAVECNLTNFSGNGYNARGIVTGTGTAAVTLYVSTALTLNTTAPIVKCFAY